MKHEPHFKPLWLSSEECQALAHSAEAVDLLLDEPHAFKESQFFHRLV
jgi:hypothetical protein